jgi:phage terminase small subunit
VTRLSDPRQELLVRNVVRGIDRQRAAAMAGYSAKSGGSIATRILKKPEVQRRMGELQDVITRVFAVLDEDELVRVDRELPRFGAHDCRPPKV